MDEQIIRYLQGELNARDSAEFRKLLQEDKLAKEEFISMQNLYALALLSSSPMDRKEGQRNFQSFFQQIKRNTLKKAIRNVLKYAAIAIVLIASTIWATLYFSENAREVTVNKLYVPAGQRAQLTLQDGTEVWLNAQSTLTYPSQFSGRTRKVTVLGEAYFNVAKNRKKPFVVTTQHIEMKVLGTQFNVYSYPETGYIQTDLVEGALKVYAKQSPQTCVTLKPNEQVTIKDGKMSIDHITDSDYFLWKDGIYTFNNERLLDIIEKLQLYFDVKIVVKDPGIFNVRYTGKFRQRDGIDEILRIIQKIQKFRVQKDTENNVITITK